MSEIAEVRRLLQEINDRQIVTQTDVTWIKTGMVTDGKRLHALEGRVNRQAGQSSVLGAIAGAIFGGAVTMLTRMHS